MCYYGPDGFQVKYFGITGINRQIAINVISQAAVWDKLILITSILWRTEVITTGFPSGQAATKDQG